MNRRMMAGFPGVISRANVAVILVEGDTKHPVHFVLDAQYLHHRGLSCQNK